MTKPSFFAHPLYVIPIGDVGVYAAQLLLTFMPDAVIVDDFIEGQLEVALENDAAHVALLSWRPMWDLCEALETRSIRTDTCFTSLVLDNREITVGPMVFKGGTCCWQCWNALSVHRDLNWKLAIERANYYRENPLQGPAGFLSSTVLLAVLFLVKSLRELEQKTAGTTLTIDIASLQVSTNSMTGRDDCPRCGSGQDLALRTTEKLQGQLSWLWGRK